MRLRSRWMAGKKEEGEGDCIVWRFSERENGGILWSSVGVGVGGLVGYQWRFSWLLLCLCNIFALAEMKNASCPCGQGRWRQWLL
jgi:hypothetical protein